MTLQSVRDKVREYADGKVTSADLADQLVCDLLSEHKITEVMIDISLNAGCLIGLGKISVPDSRELVEFIRLLAEEFVSIYKDTKWGEPGHPSDYILEVDEFSCKKLFEKYPILSKVDKAVSCETNPLAGIAREYSEHAANMIEEITEEKNNIDVIEDCAGDDEKYDRLIESCDNRIKHWRGIIKIVRESLNSKA